MKIIIQTNDPHLIKSTLWKTAAKYRNQAKEMEVSGIVGVARGLEKAAAELEEVAATISVLSIDKQATV